MPPSPLASLAGALLLVPAACTPAAEPPQHPGATPTPTPATCPDPERPAVMRAVAAYCQAPSDDPSQSMNCHTMTSLVGTHCVPLHSRGGRFCTDIPDFEACFLRDVAGAWSVAGVGGGF